MASFRNEHDTGQVHSSMVEENLWDDDDDNLLALCVDENTNNARINSGEKWNSESIAGSVKKQCSHTTEDYKHKEVQQTDHERIIPLEAFRPKYLWVSDLTKQNWCEQQLFYSFMPPIPVIPVEKPVMTEGTNLHLARELAVHDVVNVKVSSSEDIWAIKTLNLITVVNNFLNGDTIAREVPIFGAPFDQNVFLVGLIDELRFDPQTHTIELSELKTTTRSHPSKSQQKQHRLQIMLYKKLFDDLVKGQLSKETIAKHLQLELKKEFGEDVQRHVERVLMFQKNLDDLIDYLLQRIQTLTCISSINVEYVHQETKVTLNHNQVEYNDDELEMMFTHYLKFWKGDRTPVGVDIEEAWKCQRCEFADVCDWRQMKSEEYSMKNKLKWTS